MKKLYAAANLQEAKIISDVLSQHGINSLIKNLSSQGLGGELPIMANYPTIYVDDEDYEEARKLMEGNQRLGSVWTCSCGEDNEPQFSECWNCGASRR